MSNIGQAVGMRHRYLSDVTVAICRTLSEL